MPAIEWGIGDWPRVTRFGRVFLFGAFAAMAGLLGLAPGLRGQTPAKKPAASSPEASKKAVPEPAPFDLSYLPLKSKSIVAIRPGILFRRDGVRQQLERAEAAIRDLLALDLGLDVPWKLEAIEQVVFGLATSPVVAGRARPEPLISGCLMIRASEPLKWKKTIVRSFTKGSKERWEWVGVSFEGKSYDRIEQTGDPRATGHNVDFCLYSPDARTVVIGDEASLREAIRRGGKGQPELELDQGWQDITRGVIAAANALSDPKEEMDVFSTLVTDFAMEIPQLPYPRRSFVGIAGDETLRYRTSHEYPDAKGAAAEALRMIGKLTVTRGEFALASYLDVQKQFAANELFLYRAMLGLPRNCRVHYDARTVEIKSNCQMPLKDLLGLFGDALKSLQDLVNDKKLVAAKAASDAKP